MDENNPTARQIMIIQNTENREKVLQASKGMKEQVRN